MKVFFTYKILLVVLLFKKAYGDLTITCEKDDFSFTSIHKSKANMATYGNILLGDIPGALIDGGSGKGYDYPTLLKNGLD